MTAQNEPTNTLRFSCPVCYAELAVPVSMGGVEGPCPSCYQIIRAPLPDALLTLTAWVPPTNPPVQAELPSAAPLFPPVREEPLRPITHVVRPCEELQRAFPNGTHDRAFKARRAIPPAEEPLDDSWKERHRDQQRNSRRARRVERVAQSFLESRSFRLVRVGLILASGVMLAFLFHYLQNHQWRLPGFTPAVASEGPESAPDRKIRPLAGDPNELADDDTEIPPAPHIPAPPRTGQQPPIAAPQP